MALSVDLQKKAGKFQLNVQFETDSGTLALLGASGSGKSMTLQCIAGVLHPDEGRIVLNGRVLFDSAARINLPPQARHVGYLFQQYALFPNLTVSQNIAAAVRDRSRRAAVTRTLVERFQLEGQEHMRPFQLSGGQQQRTALARILASEPEALLLDEPFSALDSYLRWQLEQELSDTLSGFSGPSVWVSHNRGEVYRNCNRVCVLEAGRSQPAVGIGELFSDPKTVSAARLSGCKNYVSAVPKGECVELPVWGVTLRCGRAVPLETNTVGLRSHRVRFAEDGDENTFVCTVERTVQDVFHTILTLRPVDAAPDAPFLRMEIAKLSLLPQSGQLLTVAVDPQEILLLH